MDNGTSFLLPPVYIFDFAKTWNQFAYIVMGTTCIVCNILLVYLIMIGSKQRRQDYLILISLALADGTLGEQNF